MSGKKNTGKNRFVTPITPLNSFFCLFSAISPSLCGTNKNETRKLGIVTVLVSPSGNVCTTIDFSSLIQRYNAFKHHWSDNRTPVILEPGFSGLIQQDPQTGTILTSYDYKDIEAIALVRYYHESEEKVQEENFFLKSMNRQWIFFLQGLRLSWWILYIQQWIRTTCKLIFCGIEISRGFFVVWTLMWLFFHTASLRERKSGCDFAGRRGGFRTVYRPAFVGAERRDKFRSLFRGTIWKIQVRILFLRTGTEKSQNDFDVFFSSQLWWGDDESLWIHGAKTDPPVHYGT